MTRYVIHPVVRDEILDLLRYLQDFLNRERVELADQLAQNVLRSNQAWSSATKRIWEADGAILERIAAVEDGLAHELIPTATLANIL